MGGLEIRRDGHDIMNESPFLKRSETTETINPYVVSLERGKQRYPWPAQTIHVWQ